MTAADILAAARADGVELRAGQDGLHVCGDRLAVSRWVAAIRPVRDEIVALLQPDPRIAELRRLLVTLLWDDAEGVEPEIERTLRDNALEEALVLYRRLFADYQRLGELPINQVGEKS